jgi:hypothetical protein
MAAIPRDRTTVRTIIDALTERLPNSWVADPAGKVTVKFRSERSEEERFLCLSASATVGDFLEAPELGGRDSG